MVCAGRIALREDLSNSLSRIAGTGESNMFWTIVLILFVLWALGLATSYTLGGFIHLLLVLAIITVLIRVIQGRKILT